MKIPQITWAQNSKMIYLNIILEPNDMSNIELLDNKVKFKHDEYSFEFELENNIDIENSIINKNRIYEINLVKKDNKFWNNLLKNNKLYKNNISIDWNRWIDEDNDNDLNIDNINSDTSDDEEYVNYDDDKSCRVDNKECCTDDKSCCTDDKSCRVDNKE